MMLFLERKVVLNMLAEKWWKKRCRLFEELGVVVLNKLAEKHLLLCVKIFMNTDTHEHHASNTRTYKYMYAYLTLVNDSYKLGRLILRSTKSSQMPSYL